MKAINWDVTLEDARTINKIVKRAWKEMEPHYKDPLDLNMDITAIHANGNPLRLKDLLAADDFNFFHDLFGIKEHLDRKTGKLKDFFSPRFSRPISKIEKAYYKSVKANSKGVQA